jgi:hypothetical protein
MSGTAAQTAARRPVAAKRFNDGPAIWERAVEPVIVQGHGHLASWLRAPHRRLSSAAAALSYTIMFALCSDSRKRVFA